MPSAPACRSTTARPGPLVGVVGDVRQFRPRSTAVAQAYTPLPRQRRGWADLSRADDRRPRDATALIRDAAWPSIRTCPCRTSARRDIRDRYLATPKLTAVPAVGPSRAGALVTMAGITGRDCYIRRSTYAGVRRPHAAPRATDGAYCRWSSARADSGGPWAGARHDRIDRGDARAVSYVSPSKATDSMTFSVAVAASSSRERRHARSRLARATVIRCWRCERVPPKVMDERHRTRLSGHRSSRGQEVLRLQNRSCSPDLL